MISEAFLRVVEQFELLGGTDQVAKGTALAAVLNEG